MRAITLSLLALAFVSCTVIRPGEEILPMDPVPVPSSMRNHLLVEYTAVGCPNCPKAAEEAHALLAAYPNLFVVEMHPALNPLTKSTKYDYTAPAADTYYQYMGGTSTTPFPTGNLDFLPDATGNFFFDYTSWATLLTAVATDTATLSLAIQAEYDASSDRLTVHTTILSSDSAEQVCQLLLWLTEDNIVGAQTMPDGSFNMEYVHNHVFRSPIGPEWGESVRFTGGRSEVITSTLQLDPKYVRANCHILAMALNPITKEVFNLNITYIP